MTVSSHAVSVAQASRAAEPSLAAERADLYFISTLVLSLIGLLWKPIFTSSMLYFRDIHNYTYPSALLIQESVRHGFLPYWNPYLNYGQPLLANPNLLFFYPYTLFIILLPFKIAYTFHYVVHFALAEIGTYLLARRWDQSRAAAFFAGFIFAFSGPVLSLGNLYNHAACVAWMPWAVMMTDRALEERRIRPWIYLVLIFAMQFLAAEPFTFIATFGLSLAYALWRRGTLRRLWAFRNLAVLAAFVLVGAAMVALCAVQFIPSMDFLDHSRRGLQGLRFGETSNWSFHPLSLLELIFPNFFGSPLDSSTPWTTLVGDTMTPYFISVFVGFVPLFFALAGWTLGLDRRRNFAAVSALVFLLLSFGHFLPLFALAYLLVPLLVLVRFPIKMVIPFIMLSAILAGWGFDALRGEVETWKERRRRLLLPLACLLAVAGAVTAVAWTKPQWVTSATRWALQWDGYEIPQARQMANYFLSMLQIHFSGLAGFALGGLLIVVGVARAKPWARRGVTALAALGLAELALVNYQANPTVPKTFYTHRPPVLAQLEGAPGTFRTFSPVRSPLEPTTAGDLQSFVSFPGAFDLSELGPVALGSFQDRMLLSTGGTLFRVEGSLSLDIERSMPPYLYDVWIYLLRQSPDAQHSDCLLGRTNVKYLIRRRRADSPAARLVGEVFNGSPQPSYLYQDSCFVPRVYAAGWSVASMSSLDTIRRLASPDFDADHEVVLAAAPGLALLTHNPGAIGSVAVTDRGQNSVTLHADLALPGYVVLLDRYDPNWHATLDGREVPVYRANQLFRAVYADAGKHEVKFFYQQRGLKLGLTISLYTLAGLAALYLADLIIWGWKRRKSE